MRKIVLSALISVSLLSSAALSTSVVNAEMVDKPQDNNKQLNAIDYTDSKLQTVSSDDEEYIGMQELPLKKNAVARAENRGLALFARTYTNTQILSRKDVRELYHNLNMVNNAWTWGGALAGFKHTIIGMIMTASGNQNPAYREAITKAYYQNKRVKIVMKSGSSMSLNKV